MVQFALNANASNDRKRPDFRHAVPAGLPAVRVRLFPVLHLPRRERGDLSLSRTGYRHHRGRSRPADLGLLPVLRRLPAGAGRRARPLRAAPRAGRAAGRGGGGLGLVWLEPLARRAGPGARADRAGLRRRADGRHQGHHALVSAAALGPDHRPAHDGGRPGLDGRNPARAMVALGHDLAGPVLLAGRPLPRHRGDPVRRRARARRAPLEGHAGRAVPHHRHRADRRLLLAHPAAAVRPAARLHRLHLAVDRPVAARRRRHRRRGSVPTSSSSPRRS